MELLRFLVLVPMALSPLVNSQDHSMSSKVFAASPFSVATSSPLVDEERSSNTEEEAREEDVHMKTIPSGDEGLQLAIGDTAILECQLSIPSASHRFKSLSWTNTLTHVTMTTDNTTENSDKTMSVTLSDTSDNDNRTTTTSLVMTTSNFNAIGSTPFRCDAEVATGKGEVEGKKIQATLNVTVVDPEWLCTFEGNTNCEWKWGKSWKKKQSSATVTVGQDSCRDSVSDHTYGPSNTVGQYLIAEFIGEGRPYTFEDTILSRTVQSHGLPRCIRFFYRLCQRIPSNDPATVTIAREEKATHTVQEIQPGDRWKEFNLTLQPYEKDYQIIIAVKYNNGMYMAIDDIKLESSGNCKSEQAATDASVELLGPKSTVVGITQALAQSSTTVSSSASSSSASSASPPTSQSSVISSSETVSPLIPLTAASERPLTSGTQTSVNHRPTVNTITTSTSSSTAMQTTIANGLSSPSVVSVKTTPVTPTTLSPKSLSPQPSSSATLAVVSSASVPMSSDRPRTEATAIPEVDGTFRPTSQEPGASDNDDDGDDDDEVSGEGASAADAATNDNSTGLAIGIILAIMVAGACTAAILYRRRKNGKKSTYITFGNPSYSREHLPVNDFGLDSPLTLSSNGYTVLA